jgi:D-glycero-alpha-D-manno-heptose-7-phosphate kinase
MGDQFDVMVPVRVDLSGGWTDVNPYCTDFGGEVVNFTINKYVKANINLSGEVSYNFDIPVGSGLGTSGSVNVARIALLRKSENLSLNEIAEAAYQAEIKSGNKCGRQDQWAATFGGFNRFMFHGENVEIMPFEPARSAVKWVKKHLIIAHTGISHKSGEIQDQVWSRYEAGDKEVIEGLHRIRHITRKLVDSLQRDQRQLFVESLNGVSSAIDTIDKSINAPFLSVIQPLIEDSSVMAWKALGAGSGGCAAILCHPLHIKKVKEKISKSGWKLIEWDYENTGIRMK